MLINGFRKRDGSVVEFDESKIQLAIWKAAWEVFRRETGIPAVCREKVVQKLTQFPIDNCGKLIPTLDQVQDTIITVLTEEGHKEIARAFKDFKEARDRARGKLKVKTKGRKSKKADTTDSHLLLVESGQDPATCLWDRQRLVQYLHKNTELTDTEICVIAKIVENRIIDSGMTVITSALIREILNVVLTERGHKVNLKDRDGQWLPTEYIDNILDSKSLENSNVNSNNPEAVSMLLSEVLLKEWALDNMFDAEVKRAHLSGMVHLHDLGFPHRVYCSAHSLEFIKKYGLQGLDNLSVESKPARSASVLVGHLNTFLASVQAYYAGALGIGYINVLFAPYMVGMTKEDYKQTAQELIFNAAQCSFSRGGQVLFTDFNVHPSVPKVLKHIPAIHPGGKYKARVGDMIAELTERIQEGVTDKAGNSLIELVLDDVVVAKECEEKWDFTLAEQLGYHVLTYGDYEHETQEFCRALLTVWGEGDKYGRVFPFPKCNFHIDKYIFKDATKIDIFMDACKLASKNGSTYFIFDRDAVTLAACCRLRTTIQDKRMLTRPELLSFCGFQNVTVNIPQAAYRAKRNSGDSIENLLKELDNTMDICVKAHMQKRVIIKQFMDSPTGPLRQIGKVWAHGRPYVNIDAATYIIGLIGLNDALLYLTGKNLHESPEVYDLGLRIISHMYLRTKKYAEKYNLKFTLEESPAESAARRLAKTDLSLFPEAAKVVQGSDDNIYYTNSIHLPAQAEVPLVERIRKQSMFHSMIESGAIIHAFVGEERPDKDVIAALVARTFDETQCAQLTISPEFTYCNLCHNSVGGIQNKCPQCKTENVDHLTRVVGYFSKVSNWNKSKRDGELPDRHKGDYSVKSSCGV
jgi:anaerobic ribonucleoside-triphosphate reductase